MGLHRNYGNHPRHRLGIKSSASSVFCLSFKIANPAAPPPPPPNVKYQGGKWLADLLHLVDQLTLKHCHSFPFYGNCRKRIPIRDSSMPKTILYHCSVSSDVFMSLERIPIRDSSMPNWPFLYNFE